ncbi:SPOSA6832_00271 [Sporobolomyces salmonicolor]|uniref:Sorting nexin-4 n=1 Tax=Sporidiobolus salmonicolor TaxID=5005 RepID=A0A0D6EGW5_SPOSA|nr:SPOSA6832_00271 [Sporobolomyces salmonicolor]
MQSVHDDDFSASVAWDTGAPPTAAPSSSQNDPPPSDPYSAGPHPSSSAPGTGAAAGAGADPHAAGAPVAVPGRTPAVTAVQVKDGKVELEGTADMFVSYLVCAQTDLPTFASKTPSARRRFQDFVFMRDALVKDFPACVVPPLPDKHRMEYVVGDRFSPEFIERRRVDLERFLQRVSRHHKLSRTAIFQNFLESTEWVRTRSFRAPHLWLMLALAVGPFTLSPRQNVYKHKHTAASAHSDDPPSGLLDNLSDTLLNAFSKLKKPDDRFTAIRAHLDSFEEGLASIERLGARSRTRLGDLSGDYEDLAVSVQGLGYLESGITEPLMRFERALVEFGESVKDHSAASSEGFLEHLHSLLSYSHAFKAVLKLRDQKQLDFEELSTYLSNVVMERERLAGGYGYGMGIGNYFKEKMEGLRGGETDMSRVARLGRLDAKIKEVRLSRPSSVLISPFRLPLSLTSGSSQQLQDAVLHSQSTSSAFNDSVLEEHVIFREIKRLEMKQLLGAFADGQIAMHKASVGAWDR